MVAGDQLASRYLAMTQAKREDGAALGLEVLEIGCGTGLLTVGLSRHSDVASTVALDISKNFLLTNRLRVIEHGRRDASVAFMCADLNALPFQERSFDVILGNSILHHVYDYEGLLQQLRHLARPGAVMIFNEPVQEGKSLMAFLLEIVLYADGLSSSRLFTDTEVTKVRNLINTMLREKYLRAHPERKRKMEDKHVFNVSELKSRAEGLGFVSLEVVNTKGMMGHGQKFVERTLMLAGLEKDLGRYSKIFDAYDSTTVEFFPNTISSPHQFLIYKC